MPPCHRVFTDNTHGEVTVAGGCDIVFAAPAAAEDELVAEQTGGEPVEDRPELAEVVLDRRSGQTHAMLGGHPLQGATRLTARRDRRRAPSAGR